jgi:hypothetical protein
MRGAIYRAFNEMLPYNYIYLAWWRFWLGLFDINYISRDRAIYNTDIIVSYLILLLRINFRGLLFLDIATCTISGHRWRNIILMPRLPLACFIPLPTARKTTAACALLLAPSSTGLTKCRRITISTPYCLYIQKISIHFILVWLRCLYKIDYTLIEIVVWLYASYFSLSCRAFSPWCDISLHKYLHTHYWFSI